jgi:hypothetical protein
MTEYRAAIQVRHFAECAQYGYTDITDGGASKLAGSAADAVVRRAIADAVDLEEQENNAVIGEVTVREAAGSEDPRIVDLRLYPGERSEEQCSLCGQPVNRREAESPVGAPR